MVIKLLKTSLILIFISFVIFIFWNNKNKERIFFNNQIEGVIEYKIRSTGGFVFKLKNVNGLINLRINQDALKYFEKGDSISKPSKSKNIFLFKKDTNKAYETYFYLEDLEYLWQ
ncbi:hypothetical protein [Tenacibaculum sp. 47A_GOM-205m]|uniref:hypothetical protein n=1 Tax=Tenacibaculum sp. 47A_GOM-205m TaxID=1380384 RepID=UPI00048BCED7|nr:hypothetical protein [Tenacibaculum sp. 47A_GOM-205m]